MPGLTRKAFEKFGFATASLITDWERIAGAEMARYTSPERLKWPVIASNADPAEPDGPARTAATLFLRVDPARALDVQYKTRQIIERINAYFGYRAVAEVRIVQGVPSASPVPARAHSPTVAAARSGAPHMASADISGVADERLRAALTIMAAGIARRRQTA